MTEHELRVCYETVYKMISRERKAREHVLRSSPYLQQKLAECDSAIVALTVMKDELKRHVAPGATQETLFEVPAVKGGH